jgi:hypothetical protein
MLQALPAEDGFVREKRSTPWLYISPESNYVVPVCPEKKVGPPNFFARPAPLILEKSNFDQNS